MPTPTVVSVPASQTVAFPDVCVVCGKPAPGAKTVDDLSLSKDDGGPRELVVEAPCCRGCDRRLSLYWLSRLVANGVWFFVGGLPGWVAANLVRPWFDQFFRDYRFIASLPFILIAVLSWAGGFYAIRYSTRLWPPAYRVDLRKDSTDFAFQNEQVAAAFAAQNSVSVQSTK